MPSTIVTMREANVIWDRDTYHAAPNHIRMRLKTATPTILVNEANVIVAANEAWQDQCGYHEEAIGCTPKILQGDLTDQIKAYRFAKRAAHEGRAGTSLVNYKADGSTFLHTIVADRVGDFFVAKTTRAVDVRPPDSAPQIVAIGAALALAYALVLTFSSFSTTFWPGMASETVSAWGHPSIFVQPKPQLSSVEAMASALASGAIPFAAFFLLAFLVAAINDLTTNVPDKDKNADNAVFGSMLLGLAALIAAEGSVPLMPALALFALTVVASLAVSGEHEAWRAHDQVEHEEKDAVPEIMMTTAACFFLVTQGSLQVQ